MSLLRLFYEHPFFALFLLSAGYVIGSYKEYSRRWL